MKIISSNQTEDYHDIEIERSFLWLFKYRERYRKIKIFNGVKKHNRIVGIEKNGSFVEISFTSFLRAYNAFHKIKTNESLNKI